MKLFCNEPETVSLRRALELLGGIAYNTYRKRLATGEFKKLQMFKFGKEIRVVTQSLRDVVDINITNRMGDYQ